MEQKKAFNSSLSRLKKLLLKNIWHFIQALLGTFFAIYIFYHYLGNYIEDSMPQGIIYAVIGLVLLTYSLCQFWLIHKGNLKISQIIFYPLFYILIGLGMDNISFMYLKGWPCDNPLIGKLISFVYLFALFFAIARLTFKKQS